MKLVLVSWKEFGLSCMDLDEFVLGVGSWEDLEGVLTSFLSLPFQGLE